MYMIATLMRSFGSGSARPALSIIALMIPFLATPGPHNNVYAGSATHVSPRSGSVSPLSVQAARQPKQRPATPCSGLLAISSSAVTTCYRPQQIIQAERTLGVRMDFLVALTASGRVTLLATAEFYRHGAGGSFTFDQLPAPFPHGAPSLQISVSPRAPATRVLLLRKTRDGLRVVSPPNTHPNVLYAWFFQCTAPPSSTSGLRASAEGPDDWQPLPTDVIFQPACAPGWTLLWRVMVGAPGYAITSAS